MQFCECKIGDGRDDWGNTVMSMKLYEYVAKSFGPAGVGTLCQLKTRRSASDSRYVV